MPIKKKIALSAAVSIVLLLLLSITALPWLVRNQAIKAVQESTGRVAQIDKVSFNPFNLTLTIDGFRIEGEKDSPFVNIGSLRLSLSGSSIFKRAAIIDEVTINAPALSFARLDANSYSFSDIVDRQHKQPKRESKSDLRFSINNIAVHNGSIDFDDRAINGGRIHTVRKLELAVPFISNIPYLLDKYIDPKLSAVINDAQFSFGGKTKPLSKSRETSVRIKLNRLDLPRYAAYSPVKVPVDLVSGALTADTQIDYQISSDKAPQLVVKGLLEIDKLAINQKGGENLLKIPLLKLNASRLEIFARQFAFDSVLLDGMEVFASRNRKGQWMYESLLPVSRKTVPASNSDKKTSGASNPAGEESKPAIFSVASLAVSKGKLHFSDALPAGGFKRTLSEINFNVKNLTNANDKTGDYEFSMLLDNEATLAADGTFSVAPLSATASIELSDLKIQKAWPYLAQFLTTPVKGKLDAAVDITYSRESGLEARNGSLGVKGFSANYGSKEGFDLATLAIKDASFSQKNNRAIIDNILMTKGSISLSKESDGSISLLSLLKKRSNYKPAASSKIVASRKTALAAKPFSWNLKRFQLDRFNVSFTDKSRAEKPRFNLTNSQMSLTNLNGPKFTPAGLTFSSTFNKATPLKFNGVLTPDPFHYKGKVSIGNMKIRDFEDYFPDTINVFVIGGTLDTAMNVDIALKNGKPTGSYKGSFGVRSFHCIDSISEEDLLKWESLQLDQIQGTLEPFRLGIREVALNNVFSRIVVKKDGTLNLQNLVDKPEEVKKSDTSDTRAPAPIPKVEVTRPTDKPSITIGAVTVQDGTISFTDRHLPQTFNSTFYNLGGRVSGLSSEDAKLADVDLRGNLENHSPLQITGQINPLRSDLFIDLKISFKDIDLSPVTPYSGTFLGYTVEKGKLFLDLKYRIDKKKLTSENNVFIDQFTFGKKVESGQATSLPVRLAVALLKDRKGEIHLNLPVTGRTDDPEFSIWGVVWQVVKNLITKAVTSPFSLLSSMVGGGQDFSSVQFAIGSSKLTAPEELKLMALAKALDDRPGLKVEIKGFVEPERDAEGYRRELLNQKLRNEKFLQMAKEGQVKEGESADSIKVLPEETTKLLKAVYKKEKFPKPRNVIGLVKDIPDDEMRKLIITNTVVGEAELQKLARERATTVMDFLVKKGGLAAERLFQKNDDIHKAPEKEGTVRSRVEFNAIAQ